LGFFRSGLFKFGDHSELNPPDPIHFLFAAAHRQQYLVLAKLKLSVKRFSVDGSVGSP